MKHYAGLDLSMESTQVCIVDENGRKLVSEKVESSPEAIAGMLECYGPIERAVVETGRMSPAICLGLRKLGVAAVCIDARQAHQSLKAMKANKTDPHNAAGLAQLARTGFYKEVHVKSPAAHGCHCQIEAIAINVHTGSGIHDLHLLQSHRLSSHHLTHHSTAGCAVPVGNVAEQWWTIYLI